jgi:hypothetical protein
MPSPNDEYQEEYDGKSKWKHSQAAAKQFFQWLHKRDDELLNHGEDPVNLASVDRDSVHRIFELFVREHPTYKLRQEASVMSALRTQKRMRSKRYGDGVVVCSFAKTDGTFPPLQERVTARDILKQQREQLQANKNGIVVAQDPVLLPDQPVLPMNTAVTVKYNMEINSASPASVELVNARITGPHKRRFQIVSSLPYKIMEDPAPCEITFQTKGTGVYRANLLLEFRESKSVVFSILRGLCLNVGDAALYEALKPSAPYVRKKKQREFDNPVNKENIVPPPKVEGGANFTYKNLKNYKVPVDVREIVSNREGEAALVPPTYETPDQDLPSVYSTFWQQLLWISELQAYEDIKLFDIEKAKLNRQGTFFKLYVSGLAEGRPSVLRGDIVLCNWKGKQYRGRVVTVELLDVLLEFDKSFHRYFDANVDRVDLVRFTFTRTMFRTCHQGCARAPNAMGPSMIMPQLHHVHDILSNQHRHIHRVVPSQLAWTTQTLNEEQKRAVQHIVTGKLRPLPYIIFGPPGTG